MEKFVAVPGMRLAFLPHEVASACQEKDQEFGQGFRVIAERRFFLVPSLPHLHLGSFQY